MPFRSLGEQFADPLSRFYSREFDQNFLERFQEPHIGPTPPVERGPEIEPFDEGDFPEQPARGLLQRIGDAGLTPDQILWGEGVSLDQLRNHIRERMPEAEELLNSVVRQAIDLNADQVRADQRLGADRQQRLADAARQWGSLPSTADLPWGATFDMGWADIPFPDSWDENRKQWFMAANERLRAFIEKGRLNTADVDDIRAMLRSEPGVRPPSPSEDVTRPFPAVPGERFRGAQREDDGLVHLAADRRQPRQRQQQERPATGSFRALAPRIMRDLISAFRLTAEQAAGIVGNLAHESGGFRHIHEQGAGGGLGWAQWTGPRRQQFERFASEAGGANSYQANFRFLAHELRNTTAGRKALNAVRNADSPAEAMREFEQHFERAGVKAYRRRQLYTDQALSVFRRLERQGP